jgi:RHS repeat-associated protein
VKGNQRSEFSYDGYGRRVRIVEKLNGTNVTDKRLVWCGAQICEERDASGSRVTKRYFTQGMQQIGSPSTTNSFFYTRDHLGSIREMTDASGSVRARYEYDPYGRRVKTAGDLEADFGFTGHYFHAPSGLYLTLFRAYEADSGRWVSRDPIGELGGLNLSSYVFNSPLNYKDRLGLHPFNPVTSIATDAGAGFGAKTFAESVGLKGDAAAVTEGAIAGAIGGFEFGAELGAIGGTVVATPGVGTTGGAIAGGFAGAMFGAPVGMITAIVNKKFFKEPIERDMEQLKKDRELLEWQNERWELITERRRTNDGVIAEVG